MGLMLSGTGGGQTRDFRGDWATESLGLLYVKYHLAMHSLVVFNNELMVNYFTPSLMAANFGFYTAMVKLKHLIEEFEFLSYV